MELYHNSRDLNYRKPFGALPCGSNIEISLKAPDADYALLRLYCDEAGEGILEPIRHEDGIYTWHFSVPEDDIVLWYFFVCGAGDNTYCYGDNSGSIGGEGRIYYPGETPRSFQITVYHPFTAPQWYKEGIIYQIFPDRFCKSGNIDPKGRRIEEWNTLPYYIRNEDNSIAEWNFWGGDLQGIISRLQYIKDLGADIIYLNPIFKAASNHRYDTADYFEIDPLLGTEEDFTELCRKAKELGIRIVLDGVFNHTGRDSKYFREHPDWYQKDENGDVKCWWGVKDLPEIEETTPEYIEMICGKDGVLRHWIRLGASGWRLDVADELPNDFLFRIREAVKAEDPDALLIGEVWDDASYKIDYEQRMRFLGGRQLDSVMNYPLRTDIIEYTLGNISAFEFAQRQMSRMEKYPKEALMGCFNTLDSHDRERIITMLGSEQAVKFASALLFVLPGVPVIYYGDEIGLEGGKDPDNRRPFPWNERYDLTDTERFPAACGSEELFEHYRTMCALRNGLDCLKNGDLNAFATTDGELIIERTYGAETARFSFDSRNLLFGIA